MDASYAQLLCDIDPKYQLLAKKKKKKLKKSKAANSLPTPW